MAKKKTSGTGKSKTSISAGNSKSRPPRNESGAKKQTRKSGGDQLKIRTSATANTIEVECDCPRDCSVEASGTLHPPVPGLTNQHLEPSEHVQWEIFESNGTSTGRYGQVYVPSSLAWTFNEQFGEPGKSYILRITATWKLPLTFISERAFTCN